MTSSKEPLETEPLLAAPQGALVGVSIDVVNLNRELIYRIPLGLSGQIALGTAVKVSVMGKTRKGWVTRLDPVTDMDSVKILPILGLDDYAISDEIYRLCKAGAFRYGSRLVHFLKHARSAAYSLPISLSGSLSPSPSNFKSSYLRVSPCDDLGGLIGSIVVATRDTRQRSLVIFGNEHEARRCAENLSKLGISTFSFVRSNVRYRREMDIDADCIVATRLGVFAPIRDLGTIIVVDPEDKGHRNVGEPTWQSAVLALERGKIEQCQVMLVSGYPSPEHTVYSPVLKPRDESRCWPDVAVVELEAPVKSLVSTELCDWVRGLLETAGANSASPIVLLLNRKGRVNRFSCKNCKNALRCESCSTLLAMGSPYMEPGRSLAPALFHHYEFRTDRARVAYEKLFPRGLICPNCARTTPAACGKCKSTSIVAVAVGVGRIADELETIFSIEVEVIDDSTPPVHQCKGPLVVATEAALTRLHSATAFAFVDFDQYQFSPSFMTTNRIFRAWYKAAVLLNGGSWHHDPRDRARLLIQTREPSSKLLEAIRQKSPAKVLAIDKAERLKLDLPPFCALALVKGSGSSAFLALGISKGQTNPTDAKVEVIALSDNDHVLKAPNHDALLNFLASCEPRGPSVVVHVDPDQI